MDLLFYQQYYHYVCLSLRKVRKVQCPVINTTFMKASEEVSGSTSMYNISVGIAMSKISSSIAEHNNTEIVVVL